LNRSTLTLHQNIEEFDIMAEMKPAHEKALALAALCGFKIALGPAFLRASQRSASAQGWAAGALGEMVLDKLGVFPARFNPLLLIPHTAAGVWTARESLQADGEEPDPSVLATAAVVAAGVTVTLPMIRIALSKGLGMPDYLLGLAEDYVALQLGSRAVGMSMEQVGQVARESVQGIGEQVRPAFEGFTDKFQPTLDEFADKVRPTLQKVGVNV